MLSASSLFLSCLFIYKQELCHEWNSSLEPSLHYGTGQWYSSDLTDALDDSGRRAILDEGEYLNRATKRLDQRCFGQGLAGIVAAFDENVRTDGTDQIHRRIFVKSDEVVYTA